MNQSQNSNKLIVIAVAILVLILLVLGVSSMMRARSDPDYAVVECNEITGECTTEFPNRDQETYEPEYMDIIDFLPVENEYYSISYDISGARGNVLPVVITVLTREFPVPEPGSNNNDPLVRGYIDHVRQQRTAAIAYFEQQGFNSDNYELYFSEDYLINEFDGEHISELN